MPIFDIKNYNILLSLDLRETFLPMHPPLKSRSVPPNTAIGPPPTNTNKTAKTPFRGSATESGLQVPQNDSSGLSKHQFPPSTDARSPDDPVRSQLLR